LRSASPSFEGRFLVLLIGFAVIGCVVLGRFFQLQVLEHESYKVIAAGQHTLQKALQPKRGAIYVRDRLDGKLYPVALDRDAWQIYAVPREMKDRGSVGEQVAQLLQLPKEGFFEKLVSPTTTYMVLSRDATYEQVEAIRAARLPGIGVHKGQARLYPEQGLGGHILGFVATNDDGRREGKYGLEGFLMSSSRGRRGVFRQNGMQPVVA
jgi:penicillin-binding protein 2